MSDTSFIASKRVRVISRLSAAELQQAWSEASLIDYTKQALAEQLAYEIVDRYMTENQDYARLGGRAYQVDVYVMTPDELRTLRDAVAPIETTENPRPAPLANT